MHLERNFPTIISRPSYISYKTRNDKKTHITGGWLAIPVAVGGKNSLYRKSTTPPQLPPPSSTSRHSSVAAAADVVDVVADPS
jgi:hypothetical protein